MPFISIIIPTYNSEATLKKCLDSVLSQTFSDWEILLIDGLSKDNTLQIAQSYNDERIKITTEKDSGIYDAMNKGLAKASGEWLYFLGSDDFFYNNLVLDSIYKETSNVDFIYGYVKVGNNSRYNNEISLFDLARKTICHQGSFFRNTIFIKYPNYNTKYKIYADWYLHLQIFTDNEIRKKFVPVTIAEYSNTGFSSIAFDKNFTHDFEKNMKFFFSNDFNQPQIQKNMISFLSLEHLEKGSFFKGVFLRLQLLRFDFKFSYFVDILYYCKKRIFR